MGVEGWVLKDSYLRGTGGGSRWNEMQWEFVCKERRRGGRRGEEEERRRGEEKRRRRKERRRGGGVVLYCTVLVLYMKREKGIDIHRLPAE